MVEKGSEKRRPTLPLSRWTPILYTLFSGCIPKRAVPLLFAPFVEFEAESSIHAWSAWLSQTDAPQFAAEACKCPCFLAFACWFLRKSLRTDFWLPPWNPVGLSNKHRSIHSSSKPLCCDNFCVLPFLCCEDKESFQSGMCMCLLFHCIKTCHCGTPWAGLWGSRVSALIQLM